MTTYELTLIIDSGLDESGREKALAKIQKVIEGHKGKLGEKKELGMKEFFAPINKKKTGYYFWWKVEAEEADAVEISQSLRVQDGLLRNLLVREEKPRVIKIRKKKE